MAALNPQKCQLGIGWGTPHASGYGSFVRSPAEALAIASGAALGRYENRGYVYLKYDSASPLTYALRAGNKEWASIYRDGEVEVVMLETEDERGGTVRLDKGGENVRITADKTGSIQVGIWKVKWERDDAGKLVSLVGETEPAKLTRMG